MTLLETPARPDDLILPPQEILDTEALWRALDAAGARGASPAELRRETVPILAEAMANGRAAIAEAFAARPFDARPATRAWCWLTDCLVCAAHDMATRRMHPLANPTGSERVAVCAVGGYGRGEMAPFSDVDLLFLTPYKITPWAESVIESMLYILWDLRLKVGHASRTVRDCLRLGAQDFTIRTALLENRFLDGDAGLAETLDTGCATSSLPAAPASSPRPSSPSATRATRNRASATWSSPTSRRARAGCATCNRCSGSPSTSTRCAMSASWWRWRPSPARSSGPSSAPRASSGRCAVTCI